MNNELINAAKDQAAREIGCASWADFKLLNRAFGSVTKKDADLDFILNRAMEIYAEMVLKSRKKKSKINPYEPTGFKAINSKTTKP